MYAIFFFGGSTLSAQPQKNILRIWFDTITVKTLPTQVVMNCWFKLEGTKPHDFRGFQMPFIYESHQIAPTNYFFSGSASEKAAYHIGGHNAQTGNASVVVLSSVELDLKKSLLFSIAFIAKFGLNDKERNDTIGLMEVIRDQFELNIDSGIDSVIITEGWIKYAKEIPPEPVIKKSVTLSSDSVSLQADSSAQISIHATSLDSSLIKRGVFSFTIDTSIVRFDTAIIGDSFKDSVSLVVENRSPRVNLYISQVDTAKRILGSGELLKVFLSDKFKEDSTHRREDTVTTYLFDSSFFALNTDNLLDSVRYELGKIVILGSKADTDTVVKSVHVSVDGLDEIYFSSNPADEYTDVISSEYDGTIEMYSILGNRIYSSSFQKMIRLDLRGIASGWYHVMIRQGTKCQQRLLLIQH